MSRSEVTKVDFMILFVSKLMNNMFWKFNRSTDLKTSAIYGMLLITGNIK